MAYMRWKDLDEEQRKPLDYKIEKAKEAVESALLASKHRTAIAFSAGKDSTVLADLIRRFFPHHWLSVHLIYGNTGVEYPECVKFWEFIREEWKLGDRAHATRPERTSDAGLRYDSQRKVWLWANRSGLLKQVLKPDGKLSSTKALEQLSHSMPASDLGALKTYPAGSRKSYWWCVDQYGWPLLGKAFSQLKARRINIDTFLAFSQSVSEKPKLLAYYDVLRKVKISQACCDYLKKEPAKKKQAELRVDLIFKGLMASESRARTKNFLSRGYLFEGARKDYLGGDVFWHCQPLAIWTDDDVWTYIHRFNVPYASLYDMGYRDASGTFRKIKRNGCLGCGTDLMYPDNHMSMLRRTHPKWWFTIMSRGMAGEIQKLQIIQRKGQLSFYDAHDPEDILEIKPCYFDSLKRVTMCDDTEAGDPPDCDPEVDDAA